jgi:hypothetical protein
VILLRIKWPHCPGQGLKPIAVDSRPSSGLGAIAAAPLPFWCRERPCDWVGVAPDMPTTVGADEAELVPVACPRHARKGGQRRRLTGYNGHMNENDPHVVLSVRGCFLCVWGLLGSNQRRLSLQICKSPFLALSVVLHRVVEFVRLISM